MTNSIRSESLSLKLSGHNTQTFHLSGTDSQPDLEKGEPTPVAVISEARPEVFKSGLQELTVVIICTFAVAAVSLSSGCYQMSLLSVGTYFDVNGGQLTWAIGSNSLAVGAFLLLSGGIADAFGRKNSLIVSMFLYCVFNLITGFMESFISLCVMRALIGVVISTATPAAAGILGSSYGPSKRKNRVMACFAAGAPLGFIGGLVAGGIAAQFLSWRAVHYFLAIVYIIFVVLIYFLVPQDKTLNKKEVLHQLKALDYTGALLIVSSFTLIVFSLTQVDVTQEKWNTLYIIACLVLGIAILGGFVAYEIYIPENPLLVVELWQNRNFVLAVVCIGFCWIDFNSIVTYYGTMYFQYVKGYSPLHTTVVTIPMSITGILVNLFAAFTLHIIPGRFLMIFGIFCFLASCLIWATMDYYRTYWTGPFICYVLAVIGGDLCYNVVNMVALSSVSNDLQSRAAGTFNTFIQLAASIGLGVSSAIVSAKYPEIGTPEGYANTHGLFDAYKNAYWFGAGCAGAALVLSLFLKVGTAGDQKDADRDARLQTRAEREKGAASETASF
ncbi:hypothetical protein BABINDRAFT_39333 [Babjeviella inositovora NRRL Y-12698]|uniref:Major facilitator superfamily (MFS) profile domain-containing protein n=1 Tax=Babjeviella inositovora NRRL Y-12698 TaxID=984486 RepID=A0A1E3QNA4_9ASCO|nr:uncharacterized protein BABINDRAFT_39333 [Babjeviella inositovora NRRL Y-12698]ODQ78572.1 hypothetical protein BABINDRAFT_39333 [Babjeviella inositovora NRRL Y-12698]